MTWLRSRMYNHVWTNRIDAGDYFRSFSNIHLMVDKILVFRKKPVLVPASIACWAEKVRPHIVVDTIHAPTNRTKIVNDLRTDKTGRSRHQQFTHYLRPPRKLIIDVGNI